MVLTQTPPYIPSLTLQEAIWMAWHGHAMGRGWWPHHRTIEYSNSIAMVTAFQISHCLYHPAPFQTELRSAPKVLPLRAIFSLTMKANLRGSEDRSVGSRMTGQRIKSSRLT